MNLGLGVKFRRDQFDKMLEWKSMGAGDYVCGIQPTNCYAAGRQYEIDHGTLPMIEAGEKKHFDITLEILEGEDEYRRFIESARKESAYYHGRIFDEAKKNIGI